MIPFDWTNASMSIGRSLLFPVQKKKGTRNVEINRTEDAYISSKNTYIKSEQEYERRKKTSFTKRPQTKSLRWFWFSSFKGIFQCKIVFCLPIGCINAVARATGVSNIVYCIGLHCIRTFNINNAFLFLSRLFWIFFQMTRTHMLGIHVWHACIKDSMCWIRWMCT